MSKKFFLVKIDYIYKDGTKKMTDVAYCENKEQKKCTIAKLKEEYGKNLISIVSTTVEKIV